jgi:ABC-type multidrug transport system fused ATPase/permease subunit
MSNRHRVVKAETTVGFQPKRMTLPKALLAAWRLLTPPERRKAMLIAIASAFSGMLELASTLVVYPLISILIDPATVRSSRSISVLWRWAGEPSTSGFIVQLAAATIVLLAVSAAISFSTQVAANRFSAACQERLGRDLLKRLFEAPYVWFVQRNPLLLGNLFPNHIVVWGRDFIRRMLAMSGQITTIGFPVVLLIGLAPGSSLFALLVIAAVTFAILSLIKRRTLTLANMKREADDRTHVFLTEALQGIKDVKLSSQEDTFLKMFMHSYHLSSRGYAAIANWNLVPSQSVMLLGQVGIICTAVTMFLVGTDGATLAAVMAVVVLIGARIVPALNRLGAAFNGLSNVKPWIEVLIAVNESLVDAEAIDPARSDLSISTPVDWRRLELENVEFAYPGSAERALQAVSLQIDRGGSYAFAGPSGAGKSTVVDVILGLLVPSSGRVSVDGAPLTTLGTRRWQKRVGYVPQTPTIADSSLRSNLAFGVPDNRIDPERLRRCIALAQLEDIIEALPQGLDTSLGDRGHRLSGGQRQRVAIARALYHDPDILVLDEATSALDTLSERAIRDAIAGLHGRITVISIAHRFSTIEQCDRIFLMQEGRVIAEGSYRKLLESSDLFARLASPSGLS